MPIVRSFCKDNEKRFEAVKARLEAGEKLGDVAKDIGMCKKALSRFMVYHGYRTRKFKKRSTSEAKPEQRKNLPAKPKPKPYARRVLAGQPQPLSEKGCEVQDWDRIMHYRSKGMPVSAIVRSTGLSRSRIESILYPERSA